MYVCQEVEALALSEVEISVAGKVPDGVQDKGNRLGVEISLKRVTDELRRSGDLKPGRG